MVSLSSDGTIVAVGAPYNDGAGNAAGHVRVYQYIGSSWTKIGQDIDGEVANDRNGCGLSLSSDGTVVAMGAHNHDNARGQVRIFQYSTPGVTGGTWIQLGSDIDGENSWDWSGESISLSSNGKVVAIGAPYNDGTDSEAGHVRIWQYNGSSWTKIGQDIDAEDSEDYSGGAEGSSVSLSADGTVVAIGAHKNDGTGSDAGHVRVYKIGDVLPPPEPTLTTTITKMTGITTAERDALTGEAGMIIFNSTEGKHQGYNGSSWNNLY